MRKHYDFSKAKRGKAVKEVKLVKTVRLDVEVVLWLEKEAEKQGMGYQTYLNWFLKKSMLSSSSVEDRLAKLEDAVFNKKP